MGQPEAQGGGGALLVAVGGGECPLPSSPGSPCAGGGDSLEPLVAAAPVGEGVGEVVDAAGGVVGLGVAGEVLPVGAGRAWDGGGSSARGWSAGPSSAAPVRIAMTSAAMPPTMRAMAGLACACWT